jgi:hypothetical protein
MLPERLIKYLGKHIKNVMDYTIPSLPKSYLISFSANKSLVDRLRFLWLEVVLSVYSIRPEGYLLDVVLVRFVIFDCNEVRAGAG